MKLFSSDNPYTKDLTKKVKERMLNIISVSDILEDGFTENLKSLERISEILLRCVNYVQ